MAIIYYTPRARTCCEGSACMTKRLKIIREHSPSPRMKASADSLSAASAKFNLHTYEIALQQFLHTKHPILCVLSTYSVPSVLILFPFDSLIRLRSPQPAPSHFNP